MYSIYKETKQSSPEIWNLACFHVGYHRPTRRKLYTLLRQKDTSNTQTGESLTEDNGPQKNHKRTSCRYLQKQTSPQATLPWNIGSHFFWGVSYWLRRINIDKKLLNGKVKNLIMKDKDLSLVRLYYVPLHRVWNTHSATLPKGFKIK